MRINDEQYKEFSDAANQLFDLERIDVDCRFLQLSYAQDFCKKFYSGVTCRIMSISTTPKYFEILEKELKDSK